jgi:hypothetical protein
MKSRRIPKFSSPNQLYVFSDFVPSILNDIFDSALIYDGLAWVSSTPPFDLLCSSTVESRISKGDTDFSEHDNFQKAGGWCILCCNSKNEPMVPFQGKKEVISPFS